jgi:hypothetical protein
LTGRFPDFCSGGGTRICNAQRRQRPIGIAAEVLYRGNSFTQKQQEKSMFDLIAVIVVIAVGMARY